MSAVSRRAAWAAFRWLAACLSRWQGLLLVLAAPFLLFPSPVRALALLAVPVPWLGALIAGRQPLPRTPLNIALLSLSAMVLVSIFATADLLHSLGKITGVLLGLAAFFLAVEFGQASRRRLGLVASLHVLLGGGVGVLALFSAEWPQRVGAIAAITAHLPERWLSFPGLAEGVQYNQVAGTLLWVAPLAGVMTAALWRQSSSARVFQSRAGSRLLAAMIAGLAAFMTFILMLTQSRGGIIGYGVSVLVALGLGGSNVRRLAFWATAGLVGLAAVAFAGLGPARMSQVILGSPEQLATVSSVDNLAGRVELWSRAIYAIHDYPFTGLGMNMFRRIMPVFYPLSLVSLDADIAHAHNTWLQVALDLGIPGVIAYGSIWMTTVAMMTQALRRTRDPWLRAVSIGILGCLAGYFVYGLTDTVAAGAKPGILWWMLLALATAAWKHTQLSPPAASR